MDHFYALALAFLEMTFVMVGTGVLHSQRKVIGDTAFYLALGMLFLFAQLISALDLRVLLWSDLSFQVGTTVLFLPYLAALLLVYIVDGTLAAQRVIIGSLALFGLYYYLAEITRLECNWVGFSFSGKVSWEGMDFLMAESRQAMMALALSHLLDLFLLPIIFTRLKNSGCRLFFCVLGALTFTQIAELIFYVVMLSWREAARPGVIVGSLIARGGASIWLSCLTSIYLKRIIAEADVQQRSPLDIIFAFLGGYGQSKLLEQRALEWEGRYQQILRNASEIMVVLDSESRVLDANPAAAQFFGVRSSRLLIGMDFFAEATDPGGKSLPEAKWNESRSYPLHFKAVFFAGREDDRRQYLACSVSVMRMHGTLVRVLIGRDITEETRLAEGQQKLREQLAHAQRIESLGQLAGGIAHDFNNHLQAILGNVDLIQMAYAPENPELSRRLDKIAEIAEASGKLTSQLLGFARKGNYQIRKLDLCQILRQSIHMLVPKSKDELEIVVELPEYPCPVKGDMIQMQQIFVNLMLNAVDAMKGKEGTQKLRIYAGHGQNAPIPGQRPLPENIPAGSAPPAVEDYWFAAVQDTGHGMDTDTLQRIFEPFFTTKPVGQGTGMGLAMVYGAVTSHNGWVQVASTPGEGTVFCVFLPKFFGGETTLLAVEK